MQFLFLHYNEDGKEIYRWEGIATSMADLFEKYYLMVINRGPRVTRITVDVTL